MICWLSECVEVVAYIWFWWVEGSNPPRPFHRLLCCYNVYAMYYVLALLVDTLIIWYDIPCVVVTCSECGILQYVCGLYDNDKSKGPVVVGLTPTVQRFSDNNPRYIINTTSPRILTSPNIARPMRSSTENSAFQEVRGLILPDPQNFGNKAKLGKIRVATCQH